MAILDSRRLDRRTLLKRSAAAIPALAGGASLQPALAWNTTPVAPPVVSSEDLTELIAGNTAFALDLCAALRQVTDGNLFYSPYGVSQALAMTYAGASGETAAQMADVLGFSLDQPMLHHAFSTLNADLVARGNAVDDPRALHIANALWGEQSYPFSDRYRADMEQTYGAGFQTSDFMNAPEEAEDEINAWVADKTEGHIRDIVPDGAITSLTRLVLANAIYFFGPWMSPFYAENTRDGEFFRIDGTSVTVPFLFKHALFGVDYALGDGLKAIGLPFAGSDFEFIAVLPDGQEFEAFEERFDAAALRTVVDQLTGGEVLVHLPKFGFDSDVHLTESLQAMGITNAFDPMLADFSGMADGMPPERLVMSDVLHKAVISVDEKGAEAAAATTNLVPGAPPPEPEPPEIRFDRPFIFAIRDWRTESLLFLGRVMDPSA